MGRPKPPAQPDTRLEDREQTRYRVNGTELPVGVEPQWDDLEPWANVEKYLYGAGFLPVLPVRPVMATGIPDVNNRIHLEGPIWPPRNPS